MAFKDDRYTYRVTWSEDDQEYVGLCAEFPSLSWLALTPEAALKGIRKVVAGVVQDMRESWLTAPRPIMPPDVTAEQLMVRVRAEVLRDASTQGCRGRRSV